MSEKQQPQPDKEEAKKAPHGSRGLTKRAIAMLALTAASMGVGVAGAGAASASESQPKNGGEAAEQTTDSKILSPAEAVKEQNRRLIETEEIAQHTAESINILNKLSTEGEKFTCFYGAVTINDAEQARLLVGPDKKAPESIWGIGMRTGHVGPIHFRNPILVSKNGENFLAVQVGDEPLMYVAEPSSHDIVGSTAPGMEWRQSSYIKNPEHTGIISGYQDCKIEEPGGIASVPAKSEWVGHNARILLATADIAEGITPFTRYPSYEVSPQAPGSSNIPVGGSGSSEIPSNP